MGPVLSPEVVLEPITTCIRVSTHDANYQARDGGLLSRGWLMPMRKWGLGCAVVLVMVMVANHDGGGSRH